MTTTRTEQAMEDLTYDDQVATGGEVGFSDPKEDMGSTAWFYNVKADEASAPLPGAPLMF